MSSDDGHKYTFGEWPEMPWKNNREIDEEIVIKDQLGNKFKIGLSGACIRIKKISEDRKPIIIIPVASNCIELE